MVRGKQTCKILKDIRRQVAEANDIEYITSECQYKGDCTGTCPKCESEVRYLEHQLERKRMAGKAITLLGLSAGIIAMNACANSPDQSAKNTSEIKLECQSLPTDKDSLFLIKGTVTDSLTQKPIVGANVSEKETTNGTLTDANGEFTLKVSGKYPLIIQYVGMETQEIEINKKGATYIQVALRESNMTMGESTIISGEILEGDVDYETIETTPPEFPGGTQALFNFIRENLQYPNNDICVTGRIVAQFTVKEDGSIANARVIHGIHPDFDKEALRVINMMPKWKPGTKQGEVADTEYTVPIMFSAE
ncbi:TonB family protein [uncultured Bacteroides sp.]|nr:TonB family protein [uncultured Bacteroides sp.]